MTRPAGPLERQPDQDEAAGTALPATIRLMTPGDLDAVWKLEKSCFPTPWSRDMIERHALHNPYTRYYVAELQSSIVGYVGIYIAADEGHIVTLAVSERYRRQKIGSRLLTAALMAARAAGAKTAVLEYRVSNSAAARLYAKFGFEPIAVRPNYYRDTGEDAILMALRGLDTITFLNRIESMQSSWAARGTV